MSSSKDGQGRKWLAQGSGRCGDAPNVGLVGSPQDPGYDTWGTYKYPAAAGLPNRGHQQEWPDSVFDAFGAQTGDLSK
ncbi:hypothetical protein M419DRAFT_4886 [Trichoderma reesei RUT C-30]|uniref:Uncharacterized protein n=1 Tax=Hypocrea jecorina (strain ATCC 56765 / BCRC 32924 / NRRL 11460 / Rut C-30) TaxID=1344414 RepID=A0A024SLI1_HYPJR|nr:hypothetical protein M419DRAFT_4886 [Trichoderma reesei RUT C-30]